MSDLANVDIFSDKVSGCLFIGIVLLLILVGGGCELYRANLQQQAYERQGIKISTWEVLMGVKPAEIVVQEKKQ